MEKQYTKDKNEKLNARKREIKDMPKPEVKEEKKAEVKEEVKKEIEAKIAEMKKDEKKEEAKGEQKDEKKEEGKEEKKKKQEIVTSESNDSESAQKSDKKKISDKKEKAVMDGRDLGISKKHSMSICDFIRGKKIEEVIPILEQVVKLKKPIKMKGEIPHRNVRGMGGGRYPVNASKVFIKLLKTLNANAQVNGVENSVISVAIANDASRPFRRGGSMRFKRTNVYLEAKERKVKVENKPENKKAEEKK